ncbi:sirohydrochlorin chelatase [Pseudonocardia sp.]|jgi:sirohydrochlorin cobaltochelatase|uniref:sirohydrochlorin chelatase n=1 Tax=Pseudonocardia sp. TaxID=60912 RepID=UPI0031FDF9F1
MNVPPVLLVGHGTVDVTGVAEFVAFTDRVRRRLVGEAIDVDGGFIELSQPTVHEAWTALAGRGHTTMAAVPMVLVSAGHAKGDIPAALQREVVRDPDTGYVFGRPLGPHPVLQDLLDQRVSAALAGDPAAGTAVLLVGRGSTDPDANAEVCKVARLLQEGRPYDFVEPSFVSLARPDVITGLARCRALGARRVVVAPYFLFDGVLPRRVVEQAVAFRAEHPDVDVRVADHLGDCDELAGLVVERYREALHGDIRMNCDTCAYRVLLPGFEDKLGAPQTPHHHPDDPAHGHGHGHGGHPAATVDAVVGEWS